VNCHLRKAASRLSQLPKVAFFEGNRTRVGSFQKCSCKGGLKGSDCFAFEEFGVGGKAEGF
jgi:hypothetical protein